jgi:hypothetical protein
MRHTLAVLRANPDLARRNVLLLHDNDSRAPAQDFDRFSIRTLPTNDNNGRIKAGIENLLSEDAIEERFFQEKIHLKNDGGKSTITSLQKMALCKHVCEDASPHHFEGFRPAMEVIEDYLDGLTDRS